MGAERCWKPSEANDASSGYCAARGQELIEIDNRGERLTCDMADTNRVNSTPTVARLLETFMGIAWQAQILTLHRRPAMDETAPLVGIAPGWLARGLQMLLLHFRQVGQTRVRNVKKGRKTRFGRRRG
jgi:hypothetical protein